MRNLPSSELSMFEKKDKLSKSSLSFLLPGTGHLISGQYSIGSIFVSTAIPLSIAAFILAYKSYDEFDKYRRARDPITREIYKGRSIGYLSVAMIGITLYIAEGILATSDIISQYGK